MQASGYLFSVLPVALATVCAVWPVRGPFRRLGTATYVAGFAPSQLPVPVACYLLASTALCLAQGDLWSASGLVGLALTLGALAGLATLVARCPAHPAGARAGTGRPTGRPRIGPADLARGRRPRCGAPVRWPLRCWCRS